jgi:hypothetical protein
MGLKLMPQELEVWYLLPSLRKEIAKTLVNEHNLSQKEVAGIFGMTESAVSQYLKSKRANELKFSKTELDEIKKYANKILEDKKNYHKHLFELSKKMSGTKSLCDLHKKRDPSLKSDCSLCHQD